MVQQLKSIVSPDKGNFMIGVFFNPSQRRTAFVLSKKCSLQYFGVGFSIAPNELIAWQSPP
jgi:hypothetical protein